MYRTLAAILVMSASLAQAALSQEEQANPRESILTRDTLTGGFMGARDVLAKYGLDVALSGTGIYQHNVRGALSTSNDNGRFSGSYDLEIAADLETIGLISGAGIYALIEGSTMQGIDPYSVGSVFGVNADAAGNREADVTELWYEQTLGENIFKVRIGKLDLTGGFECRGCPVSFDCNSFANDETTQFLNNALVNNPTIPFPDNGLGLALHWNPVEVWYASAGISDAEADAREAGFTTTFDGDSCFFYIAETGLVPQINSPNGPLQGAYRLGFWVDSLPREHFDGSGPSRNNKGLYLSFDQMLMVEGDDNSQGLGVFARMGWANEDVYDVHEFASAGVQYAGLIPGRGADVTAIGFARGNLSNQAGYTEDCESVIELYHRLRFTPWLGITPSVQYVQNPGGDRSVDDAVAVALRVQAAF